MIEKSDDTHMVGSQTKIKESSRLCLSLVISSDPSFPHYQKSRVPSPLAIIGLRPPWELPFCRRLSMKMETAGAPAESSPSTARGGLSRKSSSFRLRCSSLNSVRLRRVFDLFDKNGDGLITADQIRQALVLLGLDSDPSQSALDSIVKSFIKDDNAGLTFDDFSALHKSLDEVFFLADDGKVSQGQRHQRHDSGIDFDVIAEEEEEERLAQEESDLSEAFKVFDEDGDGFISARELQVVLNKLGLPEAKEIDRVQRMISSVDTNKDGLVDFFEFKDMMRGVIVRSG